MKHTFVGLDGLRGVAALAVVSLHAHAMVGGKMLPSAFMAVDFFFALSGFVLAHAYGESLQSGQIAPFRFMRDRIIRLYPLYILGTGLGLVVAYGGGSAPVSPGLLVETLVCSLLFLPTPRMVDTAAFPLLFVAWSLFYELAVNLLYALLAPHLTPRRLTVLIIVSAAALIATAAGYGHLDVGAKTTDFLGGAGRVLFGFFSGVMIYRGWRSERWRGPKINILVIAAALVACLCFARTGVSQLLVAMIAVPALVWIGAMSQPKGILGRVCAAAGLASYPLYVLHLPLIGIADKVGRVAGLATSPASPVFVAAFFAIAFGIALAADRLWDKPIRGQVRRWLDGRQHGRSPAI